MEAFDYDEKVDGTDHERYLWGNAVWALARFVEFSRAHLPEKFGCTPCHDGQGPAVNSVAQALAMLALLFTIFFSGLVVSLSRLADGVRQVAYLAPATAGTSALQQVMFLGRSPSPYLIAILATYAASAIVLARWGLGRQKVA